MTVHHDYNRCEFTLTEGDHIARLQYERKGTILEFTHTLVPEELGGKGIGKRLILEAIVYLRQEGLKMKPVCPFVVAYAKKNEATLKDVLALDEMTT